MARWWHFLRQDRDEDVPPRALELLVVEGPDVGHQFTLEGTDGDVIRLGRGTGASAGHGAILLDDASVSAAQAVIRLVADGPTLEPRAGTRNPTLVNDREVERCVPLRPGDRIRIGRTVLEVRVREGMTLTMHFEQPTEEQTRRADAASKCRGHLVIVRGVPGREGERIPLEAGTTTIGRRKDRDLAIPDVDELKAISREHAEIAWTRDGAVLTHKGRNATLVDGVPVVGQVALRGGEQIELADRVVLGFAFERSDGAPAPRAASDDMRDAAERLAKYRHFGSFLDIDIVKSTEMKRCGAADELIIVSFTRFREFVSSLVREHRGEVLNCNGDELMCFFPVPHDAVRAASSLLVGLDEFNARRNRLPRPFSVRQGIHTGECLLDREAGIAFSDVLDLTGHLQKHADPNGVLVSDETLHRLPDGLPFEDAGVLERDGIHVHRLAGRIA